MAAREFPQFMLLPIEIRLEIWELCLPHRVFESDAVNGPAYPKRNSQRPRLSQVCQEARSVVLGSGVPDKYTGSWFSPGRDIALIHWTPAYSIEMAWHPDIRWDFGDLVHRAVAVGFSAERMHDFSNPSEMGADLGNFPDDDLDILAAESSEYLIWLQRIMIFVRTEEEARRTGLFGRQGDAMVQLIDPEDTATLLRFRDLWERLKDLPLFNVEYKTPSHEFKPEAESFFRDLDTLPARAAHWSEEVKMFWVFHAWLEARRKNYYADVENPEGVFLGSRVHPETGEQVDMLDLNDIRIRRTPDDVGEGIDMRRFSLNRGHPFVKAVLEDMPRFHPRIMFRCYTLDGPRRWNE